ncbi:hypothetical protein PFISCL1PPCAC_25325, partial [Pristionchus fissidentatus]
STRPMPSPYWLLLLLLLATLSQQPAAAAAAEVAADAAETTTEAAEEEEAIDGDSSFVPKGVQRYKNNSNAAFAALWIRAQNDESMFEVDSVEATSAMQLQHAGTLITGIRLESRRPRVRIHFRTRDFKVDRLHFSLTISNAKNFYVYQFANDDGLICPKEERDETTFCAYRKQERTFEEIRLPLDQWPNNLRNEMTTMNVKFIHTNVNRTQVPLLSADFYTYIEGAAAPERKKVHNESSREL